MPERDRCLMNDLSVSAAGGSHRAETVSDDRPTVRILGTHGVPAGYGGFETAVENIGLYLRDHGWRVIVYCQVSGNGPIETDEWNGLERVIVAEPRESWRGTSSFDLRTIRHALSVRTRGEVWLTFGYNTAIMDIVPRLRGIPNVFNMDGIEWSRRRWNLFLKGVLLANERIAGVIGAALIADHPEIARYLRRNFGRRRVRMIAYGAHDITSAGTDPVTRLGLEPGRYATVVCRPVPENSVLEIVTAWSHRRRNMRLVVVGPFGEDEPYQRAVRSAASTEVVFPGPIFEPATVGALRFHSAAYLHGHTVGGTNPSLVEALAAGNPVIAQDNVYNRWVAGDGAEFFSDETDLVHLLDRVLDAPERLAAMSTASRSRFHAEFTWERIGSQYLEVLQEKLHRGRAPGNQNRTSSGQADKGSRE